MRPPALAPPVFHCRIRPAALTSLAVKHAGIVYLVGAGPGDSGLLTLRGAELLGRADVVVYDALINPDLLRLAPKSAERIYGGKRSKEHRLLQGDLNVLLVAKAKEGKTVVRLKGGDPYTFGRGGEEAVELAAAGVAFEIVPGVSSVSAVPNYAGIPLTHRDHCSSFTVITGHEDPDAQESHIDWALLARTPGTKVVLMGLKHIRPIMEKLMAHGLAGTTPVAMIRWGTTARQQSIEGTLATIADVAEQTPFGAPAVTVIGDVVKLRPILNWFERRPLFGRRVVVTRARDQSAGLVQALAERGAEVLEIPTIKIVAPSEHRPLVEAMAGLNAYDWLIFTSANGVTWFFEQFFKAFPDLRDIGGVRIAAVGPATAAKLRELHLQVDVMPDEYVAPKVARALAAFESVENRRMLLLRAQEANPELLRLLEDMGAIVDDVACYQTVPDTDDAEGLGARLLDTGADWITFTSGSTARNFHARFDLPKLLLRFPDLKIASLGPETSKALAEIGVNPTFEAKPHTIEALVQAVEAASRQQRAGPSAKANRH
jgi:uroporphyrinogen III methyltransferase / synthase